MEAWRVYGQTNVFHYIDTWYVKKGPVHFARGYVNPAGFDVPVHLEVCECHIDAKIFYPEVFFIKKS